MRGRKTEVRERGIKSMREGKERNKGGKEKSKGGKILCPYKKYVYGKDTFCIHFMYVSIDSVYKFRIFNKQFIFEHFLKKLMYTEKINQYGMYTEF
ncbi:hypothetical protein GLOIN_2v1703178 [Rhizophagus irregularis DAOM 181602=DAOM 197198]|nr:hypothetical protein GLOIN_2v1703178 [Rhizophagus irregularis DAOM 181602=DAOM 197198]